jgi:uncharacterized membrane protein YphA (DoxX/SURF4 family)
MNAISARTRAAAAVQFLSRLLIGGVLLWSGLEKLRQPVTFLGNVYDYQLVGPRLGLAVAVLLPLVESIVGGCLLAGVWCGGAFLSSVVLTTLFLVVQYSAISRGLSISCGCFGTATQADTVNYATLLRAAGMFVIAWTGYVLWLMRLTDRAQRNGDEAGSSDPAASRLPPALLINLETAT